MDKPWPTPGVYIQEPNAFPNSIVGASISGTAFLGRTASGPVNVATKILHWGDFQRLFGGLSLDLPLTYAVWQFYANGGGVAYIVRLEEDAAAVDAPWLSPASYFGDSATKKRLPCARLCRRLQPVVHPAGWPDAAQRAGGSATA